MGAGCCKEEEIDFDAEVELSHFHLLRSVGKGAFGKVRVIQHKKSKTLYALKYINKAKCIKMRAVENIIQERRLLEEIEFPLVCNLRYAFQDDENLFMILDLMLGGDLRFHLERQGPMNEEVVKFYVAEVALGLDYLHSRKIIHRDLKPDNVLLDEKGHAHLTDFNIAVHFNEKKPLTSVAGSMAYMAPEVLTKKGYLSSVDWWSLGVVMYELLFSKRPFKGKTNVNLTQAILHEPLQFPEDVHKMVSDDCIDCLKRFCERDISKRLGCGPDGLEEIKHHPWFAGMEWDKLLTKEIIPPFVPDSKQANFDATHELEELLLEDNPLKAKKRANPNQDLSELSKEMRMMEEKFVVYDYTKMARRSHNGMSTPEMSVHSEGYHNNATRSKSGSRSSGSSTAVEKTGSSSSSPTSVDFVNALPPPPPQAVTRLPHNGHETDSRTLHGDEYNNHKWMDQKPSSEWLNEHPASMQNRELQRKATLNSNSSRLYRQSSTVSHDGDSPTSKQRPQIATHSQPVQYTSEGHTRSPSSLSTLTQSTNTSLSPPPRVQSPILRATSPPTSRPTSPLPSTFAGQSQIRNMSSSNSLTAIVTINDGIVPPPTPPPMIPLPPPPSQVNLNSIGSSGSFGRSSAQKMINALEIQPAGNHRSSLQDTFMGQSNVAKKVWGASDFGVEGSLSGNSIGSQLSSSDTTGHYRSTSDVSTGSGALSAVGVPSF